MPEGQPLSPAKRTLLERTLRGRPAGATVSARIPPRPAGADPPLSVGQEQLWFADRIRPGDPTYNVPFSFHLTGRLDAGALDWALGEVVRRHEPLRTRFGATADGRPTACAEPAAAVRLAVADLSGLAGAERSERAEELAREEAARPFDLGRPPLLRALLLRLGPEEHRLVMVAHHIASEGGSLGKICRELSELYAARLEGRDPVLPEPPITYGDYAAWQRAAMEQPATAEHLRHWVEHLDGAPRVLELPADHARPANQSHRGDSRHRLLSAALSERVRALSRRRGTTLFMTLLAAFSVLLTLLSGQTDSIIGVPMTDGDRPELDGLVGLFVNMLAIRVVTADNPSFTDVLHHVRRTVLDAFSHRDLPFGRLVEALQPARDPSRGPLFQVEFNMSSFGDFELRLPGVTARYLRDNPPGSPLDLTLYANDSGGQIDLTARFSTDLFEPVRMTELLGQMERLLEQVCDDPTVRIDSLSLATEAAGSVLPDWTAPLGGDPSEPCVDAVVVERARRTPVRTAVVDEHGALTYGQLDDRSETVRAHLATAGVGRGDVVAVRAERGAALVVAMLGVLRSGAAFAIADAAHPAERTLRQLEVAAPAAWIDAAAAPPARALADGLDALPSRLGLKLGRDGSVLEVSPGAAGAPLRTLDRSPDDLAYVAFTSGSTGRPRGVAGTHRPLAHFLRWHAETFGLDARDRFSMLSGPAHDPLLRDVFMPLWLGATLLIPPAGAFGSPDRLLEWMRERRISVAHLTPSHGRVLAEATRPPEPATALPELRWAFFGGEPLRWADVAALRRLARHVVAVNFYGATETPQAMAHHVCDGPPGAGHERVPVGTGIADVQILLRGRGGQPAGIGQLAEIHVRTPHLTRGYLGDGAETARRFLPDPHGARLYATGDLGRYRPDGLVEFAGRADGQVKIRGYRVELGDVEAVLARHPGVAAAVATTGERPDGETAIAAYATARTEPAPEPAELRAFLRDHLPEHMVPAAMAILPSLPLTPNGKVDRRALPPPRWDGGGPLGASPVAPRTPAEATMARIWASALGLPEVGVRDDFFALGGHSLLAVRVMAEVERTFGRGLPLAAFFHGEATVESLCQRLGPDGDSDSSPLLARAHPTGTRPPLFFVFSDESALLTLRHFLPALGPDQPVYGLLPERASRRFDRNRGVEELAGGLLARLRGVQPAGPYHLCGHSLGGVLAYEMACRLEAEGEQVAFLGALDALTPDATRRWIDGWMSPAARLRRQRRRSPRAAIAKAWEVANRESRAVLRRALGGREAMEPDQFDHDGSVAVRMRYRPGRFSGELTVFSTEVSRSAGRSDTLGWDEVLPDPGRLRCHEVPGDHLSMLLEPHVEEVAALLADRLAAAQRASAPPEVRLAV
jgi:amino acid adenylation domain-containing protein